MVLQTHVHQGRVAVLGPRVEQPGQEHAGRADGLGAQQHGGQAEESRRLLYTQQLCSVSPHRSCFHTRQAPSTM